MLAFLFSAPKSNKGHLSDAAARRNDGVHINAMLRFHDCTQFTDDAKSKGIIEGKINVIKTKIN